MNLVPQTEARCLFFHARCETFFDSLDFTQQFFYTFCFFFSMADASFAFFFILMLFRTSTFAFFYFPPEARLGHQIFHARCETFFCFLVPCIIFPDSLDFFFQNFYTFCFFLFLLSFLFLFLSYFFIFLQHGFDFPLHFYFFLCFYCTRPRKPSLEASQVI
jgi:hypothetical protein